MQSVQAQIDALIAAPAGRALLFITARFGLDAAEIATPRKTLELAALALAEVSRWRIYRPAALSQLERADLHRLQSQARALLASPGAAWWFAPLERSRQVWLSHDGDPPLAERLVSPAGLPSSWERYAQKPANGFFTSTLIDGSSGAATALTVGTSDFSETFQPGPIACWRLDAAPDSRVFEIDGPGPWHDLCGRYPARGEDGRIVPDWSAVASDFDAVHLTLGGLLTTEQVRIDSPSGWSQHDGWDFEQTLWLHWKFTRAERLPDVHVEAKAIAR